MQTIGQANRRRAYLLKTGQTTSYGSGSGVDDGGYEVGIAKRYTALTTGQYSGTTNIVVNGKTDTHSNACVEDVETGLMWSRTLSASVGPTSTGQLPWTTTGAGATAEGIFAYTAAANAAALAGHTDWRVPNDLELLSLRRQEAPNALPDSTAFPTWLSSNVWSSTTQSNVIANALQVSYLTGGAGGNAKTNNYYCALVRGPVNLL